MADALCSIDEAHGPAVMMAFCSRETWEALRRDDISRAADIARKGLMQDGPRGVCAVCAMQEVTRGGVSVVAARMLGPRGKAREWVAYG